MQPTTQKPNPADFCDDRKHAIADCLNASCRLGGVCALALADRVARRRG